MAIYAYRCDQCGKGYELNWRPEHEYGPEYKQMCGRNLSAHPSNRKVMCRGTLKRVWSPFNFRIKGGMG